MNTIRIYIYLIPVSIFLFGESNIDFWMFIQAKDRLSSFSLKSELIKRIHDAFNHNSVVINYPVRTIQIESSGEEN